MKNEERRISLELRRFDDWAARLADAVESLRLSEFDWGELNCAFASAAIVEACTGVDLAMEWRPLVDSGVGAARLIRAAGGLPGLVDESGLERWERPAMARRLDVGLTAFGKDGRVIDFRESPLRALLGVVVDSRVVYMGREGLIFRPANELQIAWRVG